MEDNYGTGFPGFKSRIDAVADALGGTKNVRNAVSDEFEKRLTQIMLANRGMKTYDRIRWTNASDREFHYAGISALDRLKRRDEVAFTHAASWNGANLVMRDNVVYLEGGDHALMIGLISNSSRYDTRAQANVPTHSPFITDTAKIVLYDSSWSADQSSTTAKTPEGARKSLIKLVEKHFKVEMQTAS